MKRIKTYINKFIYYYKYNGLKATLKAILRKIKSKLFKDTVNTTVLDAYKNFSREPKEYDENIIYKKKGNIYIFATVPYFDVGGGQRSSQLSKIFNKMGYSIYYIYAYECSESNIPNISIPVTYHKYINNVNYEELEDSVNKDDIFIFEAPIKLFDKYIGMAKLHNAKIIYENIDNWESSLGSMFFNEQTLKMMLNNADMIVATAQKLVEQTEKYIQLYCNDKKKKVYYLANAVDDDIFEPRKNYEKPTDIEIGKKTLLYYGSLWGEWFDWELIEKVANSNKDITINLIGDYSGIPHIVSKMPKNVHFLGIKKQIELPAYLKYSDFAILPFKIGKIGDYVSPLKIFEYISMNTKVLATELPDIAKYPNVFLSSKAEEWINEINSNNVEVNKDAREEFIFNNNWYDRCTKMIDVLFPDKEQKFENEAYGNISIVVLNYNNKKVITKCVDTLLRFKSRYNYEIIIVDNMSSDGSYELLQKEYKDKIKLVRNEKNGCSSGRNLGVKNASGKYILFLDSDEWILEKYWLDNYIELMQDNPQIGAIGWGAGWFNSKGYSYKVVDAYEFLYMPPEAAARKDIGYLATCGFLIEKKLIEEVEMFDINYDPTCYEDTDLSLKVRNVGKEIYYSKLLSVGHIPHQTTKSGTSEHDKLIKAKGEYFIAKWKKINSDLIFKYVK